MQRVENLLNEFATPSVIFRREFKYAKGEGTVLFHPDLTDAEALRAIMLSCESFSGRGGATGLLKRVLLVSEAEIKGYDGGLNSNVLSGDSVIFLHGIDGVIVVNTRKYEKRAVAEPPTETVVKGPREGFVEEIKTNLTLIEKRLKTPFLAIEKLQVGSLSNSTVALVYLSNVVDKRLIKEVRERIKSIKTANVIDSYYIQPYLEDRPTSLFSQVGTCEKPDIVAGKIAEGRVAIVVEGSPIVLTVPFLLIEDFQSAEDYYSRPVFATFVRILRLFAVMFAVMLPSSYVAVQLYHHEVLPAKFLITILSATKGIPLPPLIEVLFVIMLFEIIREASVRMPRSVGTAMSIVGALVLGDTAVKAGLISSPSVMIVALSSIALYTVPDQVGAMSIMRIVFCLAGGACGLYGIAIAVLLLILYLSALNSFSTPYLAPFAPLITDDLGDTFIKAPTFLQARKPYSLRRAGGSGYER